ncbi:hypothetical protein ATE49_19355 [Elizabethkingia miricola]|uniref:Uncharacterized protein n=1 Tax=Elizabethkingia miricola TaxID=172045 RepID=A0ABY3NG98_ELIMR|nr:MULTISPECIES: hypothetical protein [Elizabethkingia]EJC8058484.1 hypothetical protein [Elizabethkingia anophelis]MCT4033394.1 hypothetical protein [Elizabethkingia anophelis]MDV3780594.1 hypothetical protein [Elizabethkingia anophelis]MDV3790860.1 hypothetical protein [Elizabethkingia anophelis]MDV3811614.1 hypothetical protein [Elizabethkingia anophelis]
MEKTFFSRTTRVEAVINSLETVLEKSRELLMDDDIRLIEESLVELRKLDKTIIDKNDTIAIIRVIIDLLHLFGIENLL